MFGFKKWTLIIELEERNFNGNSFNVYVIKFKKGRKAEFMLDSFFDFYSAMKNGIQYAKDKRLLLDKTFIKVNKNTHEHLNLKGYR